LLADGSESEHFDLDGPRTVGNVGEGILALWICDCGDRFVALCRGYCCAGDWEAGEFHGAVVFGG